MIIHIINPYATMPNEGWRKYRSNILAEQLAEHNHNVTLWISNIDHRSKTKRSEIFRCYEIKPNYKIKIVPSTTYKKNASYKRINYERNFAKEVRNIFEQEGIQSDCIIITDPCIFIGNIVFDIVKKTKSKFIIDILDIWPEVFKSLFPKPFRIFSNFLFKPLYQIRKKLYNKSDGIVAVTNDYLENAFKYIKSKPSIVVYIGIDFTNIEFDKLSKTISTINKNSYERWIIYAGTLGLNYDVKSIMDFAKRLEFSDYPYKLIIAGDGPLKEYVTEIINSNQLLKTIYVGRLDTNDLNYLYSKCDIAFSTYLETSSVSMPVKAFDYITFGLPIVNSLEKELGQLVRSKLIGVQYKPESSESLFDETIKLLNNNKLLLEMKQNALNLSTEFSIQLQYIKYIEFIETVCN